MSEHVERFKNSNKCQGVKAVDITSNFLHVAKGVPQGSILRPLLFISYISILNREASNHNFHFYADDTAVYFIASAPHQALHQLQQSFNTVQCNLCNFGLIVNATKTKLLFSNTKSKIKIFLLTAGKKKKTFSSS